MNATVAEKTTPIAEGLLLEVQVSGETIPLLQDPVRFPKRAFAIAEEGDFFTLVISTIAGHSYEVAGTVGRVDKSGIGIPSTVIGKDASVSIAKGGRYGHEEFVVGDPVGDVLQEITSETSHVAISANQEGRFRRICYVWFVSEKQLRELGF